MITPEARKALEKLEGSAKTVVDQWAESEDRTHIHPEALAKLKEAVDEWFALEYVEG